MKTRGRKNGKENNISQKIDNNLRKNSVERRAEDFMECKVLLKGFEKGLYFPAQTVQSSDFVGGKEVNVSAKSDGFAVAAHERNDPELTFSVYGGDAAVFTE